MTNVVRLPQQHTSLATQTLNQRQGLAAYNQAHRDAIHQAERVVYLYKPTDQPPTESEPAWEGSAWLWAVLGVAFVVVYIHWMIKLFESLRMLS